jgi:hypothetical protein
MPTLVLRENIPSVANIPAASNRRKILAGMDPSLEGILIFSGIGLTLTMLGIVFQLLELPPPYF